MEDFFNGLIGLTNNEYASSLEDGNDSDVEGFIDTGSYSLNALISGSIYGGIPDNKITAIAGEESCGKSFYALNIAAAFLKDNPDGAVFYFESESALTTNMIESRGIDPKRIFKIPVVTIQEFRTQAVRILDEYLKSPEDKRPKMLYILDSMGNLSTEKEVSDIGEGKDTRDMTRAQLFRATFRVLTLKLGRAKVAMLVINHTYQVTGAYIPTKELSGGGGLKFAASTIVFLSKSKARDTKKEIVGAILTAKLDKSRLTIENKSVETLLDHRLGLNRYYGLLEISSKHGIIKKLSTQYEFPNIKSAFESAIYKNPEKYFTKEILNQIDEACKKEFKYGAPIQTEENGGENEIY